MSRDPRFAAFSFIVEITGGGRTAPIAFGGFSDCSGLDDANGMTDYRADTSRANRTSRTPLHHVTNVTLKRGLVNVGALDGWMDTRDGVGERRNVSITLFDEQGTRAKVWQLRGALPIKYSGPALGAKGTDVTMEELTLSVESISVG